MGSRPRGEHLERISASPQYDREAERFVNELAAVEPEMLPTLYEWIKGNPNSSPSQTPPVFEGAAEVLAVAPDDGLRVTWLGHSTLIIEVDGARFLTDPVWGDRVSPWSFMGPSRFHAPPLALDDLPELNGVVISHDHYDHLDTPTIKALADRVPRFFVPLGVGSHLEYWGVDPDKIVELDWWDEREVGGIRLVATPSRHFSGRGITDRDKTLWASWSFVGPEHRAYFSGDTAMFPGFREIGERLGPFDITMIESGAYNRRWADVHLGPEQALQAHVDVGGRLMMPVHWGTFDLALHAWTEPAERLLVAAEAAGVPVVIPRPGQSVEPSHPTELVRWWPDVPWQTSQQHAIVSSGLEPRGTALGAGALAPTPAG